MKEERVIIMGAAGRDFHNFNTVFRNNPAYRVVAFTAAQIPFIAERRYPPALAGRRYPEGIPIHPESSLLELIRRHRVSKVVFAYSDIAHAELMHKASAVLAAGADFWLIGPDATMLASSRPVISVCAVRTGCGKSQVTRHICALLADAGVRPVVVRHPMPYGDLATQVVERFAGFDDLSLHHCTIEEREEFEPLVGRGTVVYAGIDYERILREAEREGEVIVWDGGNNDFPFFRSDLEIVLVDPLRPGHETAYFPGEVNLRRAGLVVVNKANAAAPEVVARLEEDVRRINPKAEVVRTFSRVIVSDPGAIAGKRVLVIEDGPTVTHGGMPTGAGYAAALESGAAEVLDPRPWAVGSIAKSFEEYSHLGPVLPAMGYSSGQVDELRRTIEAVPCEAVVSATPVSLERLFRTQKPMVRVFYEIEELPGAPLRRAIGRFLENAGPKC
ncbi:cyclic 2,3-diphosphoglycerate synthase [Geobacter sp.]|uniref:cyclic 2,3-diphosphoglycerate synthase n=1 Tax=Geobacter sp. TaxID=46610 RepID=UPI00262FB45A|nr:cyclic 2,3-diphosphoglycerate synthase [Geobacter sp.]